MALTERELIQVMFDHVSMKLGVIEQGFNILADNNWKNSYQQQVTQDMKDAFDFITKMVETLRVRRNRPTQTPFTDAELRTLGIDV